MIEILAWVFIVIILSIFAIILDMLLDIYIVIEIEMTV